MAKRITNSFIALIWIRLLVGAMGKEVYDLFLAFKNIFALGGLGELGMGGAISLKVGHYLGGEKTPENEREITRFLSCARFLFVSMAGTLAVGLVASSPLWLEWLGYVQTPASGSLLMVVVMGGIIIGQVILVSYASNLNYACGNIVWPALPSLVMLQLAFLGHWILARHHAALWMQFVPYLLCSMAELLLLRYYLRLTHPTFSKIFPLNLDRSMARTLLGSSFWVYLCSLGNAIYVSTDGQLIKAGSGRGIFPVGTLTDYTNNYKLCELVVFVVLTASFVSLPKITSLLASKNPEDREKVRKEMRRLNQFQTLLGCGAALAYLGGNDIFMKLWWGFRGTSDSVHVEPAALILQVAFALNVAVTTSGDTAIQMCTRTGVKGLKAVGIAIALTGLLNLGLSIYAMETGRLWGIAMATVSAQAILSMFASSYICREMKLAWLPWLLRGCIVPIAAISLAGWIRMVCPPDSLLHGTELFGSYAVLFVLGALGLGVNVEFIRSELKPLLKMFSK
jgi:hypothetical protein